MKRSESIAAIAKALADSQKEYTPVPKNKIAKIRGKNNTEYSYKYADLADVLSMAVPILAAHGIAFLQPNERAADKLFVTTLLIHESGEWMQSDGIEVDEMEMKWNEFEKKSVLERCDPRTIGGDFTYYRRYDGCSFIGIAPDEDVDGANHGPLPDKRGKNTTESTESSARSHQTAGATSTQQSAQQAHQRAATSPAGAQPQRSEFKTVIKSVKEIQGVPSKPANGDIPAMPGVRPRMVVTFLDQLSGTNEASCFDTGLWPTLHDAVGLEGVFLVAEKDSKGKHYINVEDVLSIDGTPYVDGKPAVDTATGEVLAERDAQ